MEQVARFISEKTGKPVIPHEEVNSKRITIVSTEKMSPAVAMQTLREALRLSGVVMEEHERVINLRPLEQTSEANLPLLGPNDPLGAVDDRAMIVRKVFTVRHQDPVQLREAITPMLPTFGGVVADPNTRQLMVTDTVAGLARVEEVIAALDVPAAADVERKIFPLQRADASWVVQVLKLMLSGEGDGTELSVGVGGQTTRGRPNNRRRSNNRRNDSVDGAISVSIAGREGTVLLLPDAERNWVLAVAPAATMREIEQWVRRLDGNEGVDGVRGDAGAAGGAGAEGEVAGGHSQFTMISIQHADIDEVAQQVSQALSAMPGVAESVQVVPFVNSRKLLVFGSRRGQQLVHDLLAQLDVPDSGSRVMRVIQLEFSDAETVAENIRELFASATSGYGFRGRGRQPETIRDLKVTADPRRNSLAIVSDAITLDEIETLIREQWDLPVEQDQVQPRVYTLKHADPVQVQDLLTNLFSRREQSFDPFRFWYGGNRAQEQAAPVGRLFGQFTFQSLPDSNRLVVTTKNIENYSVIDQLIEDLDQPGDAGLPRLVELRHAHAEDLAEQINAALAEPGTLAEIVRTSRQLTLEDSSSGISDALNNTSGSQQSGSASRNQANEQRNPNAMQFWWQRAQRNPDEQSASNLIGKLRVVPVVRRNALLIVAPDAYRGPIETMVEELDQPGAQVIIRAVVAEIQHDDASTLGLRLASSDSLLSDPSLADQTIGIGTGAGFSDIFGGTYTVGNDTVARGVFDSSVNVNALLQLLIREFGLQILTEPKLYTADNEEAEFFDGSDVSVQTADRINDDGGITRSFKYVAVGTRLRVRPHITREGDVQLLINLELSSIAPGRTTFGNPTFDRRETTTRIVVKDGQTIMLSGIVRQEEFRDVRKLPLLGDIPLFGRAFRSTDRAVRNRELILFITPDIVENTGEATDREMQPYRDTLERMRERLGPPPVSPEAD